MRKTLDMFFTDDAIPFVQDRMKPYRMNTDNTEPDLQHYKHMYASWIEMVENTSVSSLPPSVWAHQMEVQATAELLHCEIHVYTNNRSPPSVTVPHTQHADNLSTPIVLLLNNKHYEPDIDRTVTWTFLQSVVTGASQPDIVTLKSLHKSLITNGPSQSSLWIPPGTLRHGLIEDISTILQRTIVVTGLNTPSITKEQSSVFPPIAVTFVATRFEPILGEDVVEHLENVRRIDQIHNTVMETSSSSSSRDGTINALDENKNALQSQIDDLYREAVTQAPSGAQPGTPQHGRYMDTRLHAVLQSLASEASSMGDDAVNRLENALRQTSPPASTATITTSTNSSTGGFLNSVYALPLPVFSVLSSLFISVAAML